MSRRRTRARQQSLLDEVARIVIAEGLNDYRRAKRKALRHLGLGAGHPLPSDEEVEAAVRARQDLFDEDRRRLLAAQRRVALAAMELFVDYHPHLVGPVLAGTAGEHDPVTLHLFADAPEEVEWFLHDRGIPFDLEERRLRLGKRGVVRLPMLVFVAGETLIQVVVLPTLALRQPPSLPHGDGRPLPRANLARLRRLLEDDQAGG